MRRRDFVLTPLAFAGACASIRSAAAATAADLVQVSEQDWTDTRRKRVVPVRVYEPAQARDAPTLPPGSQAPVRRDLPLILFSHGLGGSRAGGEQWGRLWAAQGFISVHLQHPGSDEALWKDKNPLQGFAALRRASTVENGVLRIDDVKFVIDEITRRQQSGDAHFARADLARIGMSGHSFGARTTFGVVSIAPDARIRAAVAFSPAPEASEALTRERMGHIAIPFLSLTGTDDKVLLLTDTTPEERRLPYQFMRGPDKYLLVLAGGDHMVFNGQPRERKWSNQNLVVHAPWIERTTLTFWKAYLKGDAVAKAELTGGALRDALGANGEWFAK